MAAARICCFARTKEETLKNDGTAATAGTSGDAPAGLTEAQEDTAIHSRYASNIRLSPIVRKFAALLHEQLELADTAQSVGDVEALARFGHWLTGTAGTMGYDAFTMPARELQELATRGDAPAAAMALRRLAGMASRLVVPDALRPHNSFSPGRVVSRRSKPADAEEGPQQ
jgi:HPt (histidine-containing phosphotransfer) domain-containing protein